MNIAFNINKKCTAGNTMLMNPLFADITLHNRLGQQVSLSVYHLNHHSRDCVFVAAPSQQASSLVRKNAEPFAFQLRELFALDPRRFDLIEVREADTGLELYRWRFEWVGNSPLSARAEEISSVGQRAMLLGLITAPEELTAVGA
jgi:hypothetical protein